MVAMVSLPILIWIATELKNAPYGYEDEDGFHFVYQNNNGEIANVSCVWIHRPTTSARLK